LSFFDDLCRIGVQIHRWLGWGGGEVVKKWCKIHLRITYFEAQYNIHKMKNFLFKERAENAIVLYKS
jgi:hypothetical protein